jgi:hypothetical protein
LDPGDFREVERELVERVTSVLRNLGATGSIGLSAEEFGDVLNAMVREYDRGSEAGQEASQPSRIWLTTPEGIDQAPRPIVFYLGLDDQRVPRPATLPWPRYVYQADENQQRERYLFLAAVRAASQRLYLSYAQRGERQSYRPSVYFDEVRRVLNTKVAGRGAPRLVSPESPRARSPRRARRERYRLDEVAIFGLCPYRYMLERLDQSARHCRDGFQMRFVAQGHWLSAIFEHVLDQKAHDAAALRELFQQARCDTREQVRQTFRGLRESVWTEVEHQVRSRLDAVVEHHSEQIDVYEALVEHGPRSEYVWDRGDYAVRVQIDLRHVLRIGRARRVLTDGLFHQHWLLPGLGEPAPQRYITFDGLQLFADLYHASHWWQAATRTALNLINAEVLGRQLGERRRERDERRIEIERMVHQIEAGHYPKHPGNHCQVCPARHACLGVSE